MNGDPTPTSSKVAIHGDLAVSAPSRLPERLTLLNRPLAATLYLAHLSARNVRFFLH
jgi:hypothetical protein